MRKKLQLTTPTVQTNYIGSIIGERMDYLLLPDNYAEDLLHNDVLNGATVYQPCEDFRNSRKTSYTIVTAPTCEDGYRAILYLAGLQAIMDGHTEAPQEFVEHPPVSFSDLDFDIDMCDEEDVDDECIIDMHLPYREHFSRVPLIPITQLYSFDDTPVSSSGMLHSLQLASRLPMRRSKPWWSVCTDESVCIVKEDPFSMGGFSIGGDLLSDREIRLLSRFKENKHVYILLVGQSGEKENLSITKAIMEYTANYFCLTEDNKPFNDYYRLLFKNLAGKYGFKLSKRIDEELLIKKLIETNPQHPCESFEKMFMYFKHLNAPATLTPESFRKLGLSQILDKSCAVKTSKKFLGSLYGMEEVGNKLEMSMTTLRYNQLRVKNNLPALEYHKVFLFIGAPGTAKTTAAKLLAEKMASEGLIPGSRFTAISGAQLKGAYVGQTAPKVHSLFEENDAIFIDEAYSLASSNDGEIDMYAQEALAQLAIELEMHSTTKLIIFAGYGGSKVSRKDNKMFRFIDSNPGIKSRINTTIFFDSYEPETMVEIIHKLAEDFRMKLGREQDAQILSYFKERYSSSDFGNGREARSFLEGCQLQVASRILADSKEPDKAALSTITGQDVVKTIENLRLMNSQQKGTQAHFGYVS